MEFPDNDPTIKNRAQDWGFHQDAGLSSIISDKVSDGDNGHSIKVRMDDSNEPANISYMCMQMKQKFLEENRLKTQRHTVRTLSNKLKKFQKDNHHILARREYQLKTLAFRNKMDILQPNDDVNNGGYLKSYKLLKSPKGLT